MLWYTVIGVLLHRSKTDLNVDLEMPSHKNDMKGEKILDTQIKLVEASIFKRDIFIIN